MNPTGILWPLSRPHSASGGRKRSHQPPLPKNKQTPARRETGEHWPAGAVDLRRARRRPRTTRGGDSRRGAKGIRGRRWSRRRATNLTGARYLHIYICNSGWDLHGNAAGISELSFTTPTGRISADNYANVYCMRRVGDCWAKKSGRR